MPRSKVNVTTRIRGQLRLKFLAWGVSPAMAEALDANTDLYLLGVYEGDRHKHGKVTVFLGAHSRPIALVLTAYESVDWQIELEPGALLERVFLSGYHAQRVTGLPSYIPVQSSSYDQRSPKAVYGYDERTCARVIDAAVQQYGKAPIEYHCQYKGAAFVIDGSGIRPLPVQ